jgi:hypothetical protein
LRHGGQRAHFVGNKAKGGARGASAGGLDGGVDRQKEGFIRDCRDGFDDGADGVKLLGEFGQAVEIILDLDGARVERGLQAGDDLLRALA